MELPLRILELDGQQVNWAGQTRDISFGGVRFVTGNELTVGGTITYLVTLSGGRAPVQIRCVGKVLRCEKVDSALRGGSCEAAVGMERYTFVRQVEPVAV
jgi:hypothetical protein